MRNKKRLLGQFLATLFIFGSGGLVAAVMVCMG